ncbi:MAG: hypothetical protein WAM54_06780 [Nitrososphaeraceae archaeon]
MFILVILTLVILNNYNDGYDIRNNINLNRAFAQANDNDSSPMVGMNMRGYYTTMSQEREVKFNFPSNYYEQSFKIFSQAGVEFVRYVFFWESYEKDPFSFMSELQTVAQTADKWGIKVIYANDQYDTSSWLGPKTGTGFPSFLFKNNPAYPYGTGGGIGEKDIVAKRWWDDWFNRSVKDANGMDGWTLQAEFLKKIVDAVDTHESTLGYEILNEPHVHHVNQWEKIGKYNSFITDQLRTVSQKTIFFDRQVPSELDGEIRANPENMAKMAPENTENVIFKSTIFGLPTDSSYAEARLHYYAKTAELAGVPLCICEFNLRAYDRYEVGESKNVTMTQDNVDLIVTKINELGAWGWAAWLWSLKEHSNPNYDFVDFKDDTIFTTQNFDYVKSAFSNFNVQESRDTISPGLYIASAQISPDKRHLYTNGYAFDVGSGIKSVRVHTNDGEYVDVLPTENKGIWNWTATLPIAIDKSHRIIGLAVDNSGKKEYTTRPLNLVNQQYNIFD